MTILGKLICRLREICGIRPVHRMRRVTRSTAMKRDGIQVGTASCCINVCTRCHHTVPIKPRGPRKPKTQEIQK